MLTNLRTRAVPFAIQNDPAAITQWLAATPLPQKLVMGCEATGGYHVTLARTCAEKSFVFKVVNLILAKQFTRATICKQKTDRSDAVVIAKLFAQGEGWTVAWNTEVEITKATQ